MLGHVTQNHALQRLGDFVVVDTTAIGLQPLSRNSNGPQLQGVRRSSSPFVPLTKDLYYTIWTTPVRCWQYLLYARYCMVGFASNGKADDRRGNARATRSPRRESPFWSGLDILASRRIDSKQLSMLVANPTNNSVG